MLSQISSGVSAGKRLNNMDRMSLVPKESVNNVFECATLIYDLHLPYVVVRRARQNAIWAHLLPTLYYVIVREHSHSGISRHLIGDMRLGGGRGNVHIFIWFFRVSVKLGRDYTTSLSTVIWTTHS